MIEIVSLIVLAFVVILQGVERFFHAEQVQKKEEKLLEENSRLVKALISKNAEEYVMTTSIDKIKPEKEPPVDTDLIPEEQLSDEEFFKAVEKETKQ